MVDIGRTQFKFDFYMLGYQIVSLNDWNDTGYVYECSGIYFVVVLCIFLINICIFLLSSSLIEILLPLLCACALSALATAKNMIAKINHGHLNNVMTSTCQKFYPFCLQMICFLLFLTKLKDSLELFTFLYTSVTQTKMIQQLVID